MDRLLIGVFALNGAGEMASPAKVHPIWILLAVIPGAVALRWRRSRPLTVLAVVTALFVLFTFFWGNTVGYELAIAFGIYAVAASHRPLITWTSFAAATMASVTVLATYLSVSGPGESAMRSALATMSFLSYLAAVAFGTSVRARRLHIGDLIERANSLARDRHQQTELAAARERARIAREMHDVVAHSLTVMVALADGARASATKNPALADQALCELSSTGRQALTDMRRVLGVLRDIDEPDDAPRQPVNTDPDTATAIEQFRMAGLPIRVTQSGPAPDLDPSTRYTVHRVVLEALTNVLRYAPLAPTVLVEYAYKATPVATLTVRIENTAGPAGGTAMRESARDGESAFGTGRGIIGMRQRVTAHGGTLTAGPTAKGWRVLATFPLIPPEENDD